MTKTKDEEAPSEIMEVVAQRFRNLLDAGFPDDEALELAGLIYIDWHVAADLHKGGCPYQTILEILT